MLSKAVLIYNPRTGRYGSRRVPPIETVCERFAKLGVKIDLRATRGPGHATEIAHAAAHNGSRNIIVSGGDGTINEALQGVINTDAKLAILPRGTANVLARDLGMPLDSLDAADVIAKGNTRRIYAGLATALETGISRYFFLMAGIGLDASVVQRVHPQLKKRFGKAAFWLAGFSHLTHWKPTLFDLEIDEKRLHGTFAAIGKAASYGGDLAVTPRARLEQPDFEVFTINSTSRLRYLRLLPYVMRGGVPQHKDDVQFVRTTRVVARGQAPVQVDGELIGNLPMTFEIAANPVEIVVP